MNHVVLLVSIVAMIVIIGFDGALALNHEKRIKQLQSQALIIDAAEKADSRKNIFMAWTKRILMYFVLANLVVHAVQAGVV